jgi:hypothetical protein
MTDRGESVRRYLKQRHANVEPDPGFADRVRARLARRSADLLGLAALRLLPATLALVLVLAWLSIRAGAGSQPTVSQTTGDDLIGWLIEDTER